MALQYNTSDESYNIQIPYSRDEILTINQEYVNPIDIAPTRNRHNYSLFPHDTGDEYFYGVDTYSKYLINGKDLDIDYEKQEDSFIDTFSTFEVNEQGSLIVKYKIS